MKKDFAVIGLGAFGRQLCYELNEQGATVIALDLNEERVEMVAEYIPQTFCCDCTKEDVLKKLDLNGVSCAIITIKDMAASILISVLLKEMGVQKVMVRAEEESTKKILLRLGVDEVVNPQELAVNNLCGMLLNKGVKQYFEVNDDYSVATLVYSGTQPSHTLLEMNLRNKYDLNVLLIQRDGKDFLPDKEDRFLPGDSVVVFGTDEAIHNMGKQIK